MHSKQEVAQVGESFSRSLRERIKAHYGRIPSAAFLSGQFNLRRRGFKSISSESFRRWMRGLSFPRPDHLQTLASWLNLDLNQLYCQAEKCGPEPPSQSLSNDHARTQEMSQLMHLLLGKLNDAQRQEISAIVSLISSQNVAM